MPARVESHACTSRPSTCKFLYPDRDFPYTTSTRLTSFCPKPAPEVTISFAHSIQNYINISYQPAIITNTQHPIHIPDTKINTNHGKQSKPALCYAKHRFKSICVNSIDCNHYPRNSPRSSQGGSGTHKGSSPWMHHRHQDLHVQNVRWSCVENVSDPLLLLCFCFCWAHANDNTIVR